MQQRDYFERLFEQIAAFVATILGLARAGKFDEAEHELDNAWSALGLRRCDVSRLDDTTLQMMLGPKIGLAIKLLETEADLQNARGALPLV